MEKAEVEGVLKAVGQAFRLSQLYPRNHPSLVRAIDELRSTLVDVSAKGTLEFKVTNRGLIWNFSPILQGHPAVGDLAGQLYTRGVRNFLIGRGVTPDHVFHLFGVAGGDLAADDQALGPIVLVRSARKSGAVRRRSGGRQRPTPSAAGPVPVARRSTGVFRPDALPADIEARRMLVDLHPGTDPAVWTATLKRIRALAQDLLALRDVELLAELLTAIGRFLRGVDDPELQRLGDEVAGALVDDDAVTTLVRQLAAPGVSPERRRLMVSAVGVLADRAVPAMLRAYPDVPEPARLAYAAAVRASDERVVDALLEALDHQAAERVAAAADLLGAAGTPAAFVGLAKATRHADATVRMRGIRAMAEIAGPALGRAAGNLLKDPEPRVRCAAARALVAAEATASTALIVGRLEDEEDDAVVADLLWALGRLGGSVDTLVGYLETGGLLSRRPIAVRIAAARALADVGTPEAREALMQFRDDRDAAVRDVVREVVQ